MPWDLDLGAPKYSLTYETLERWVYDLSISRKFLSLTTLFWIRILAQGMSVTAKTLSTTSQYRSRCAKRWGATDAAAFDFEEGTDRIDDEEDKSVATAVLNEMIAVYANMAPAAEKTVAILNAERVTRDLAVMDAGLTILKCIPPELPGRRDIVSTDVIQNIYSSWERRDPEYLDENTSVVPSGSTTTTFGHDAATNSNAISRNPVPHFKPAQNAALLQCIDWFIQDAAHIADPRSPPPRALHLHISGAAGTGKTTFVQELIDRLGAAVPGSVICVAPTGIAASGLPSGMTIHTAFAIAIAEAAKGASTTSKGAVMLARDRLQNARIIVIDEISMVSASLLVSIDVRLRDWFNGALAFGGLSVVLMGDFFQLPAIQGSLLNVAPASPAGLLFGLFQLLEFSDQCRAADDPEHAARLDYFRNPSRSRYPVEASQILHYLPLLSHADVDEDPGWCDAPVVVCENIARHFVNKSQAIRDATRTSQPVLTWRNVLDPRTQSLCDRASKIHNISVSQLLEKYPETSSYFVAGARVMLRDNLMTEKRISNGTTCVLHSITFDPSLGRDAIDAEFARIANTTPGTVVELKYVPYSVNVRLNENINTWDPAETLDSMQVVIPLTLNKRRPREFKSSGRHAANTDNNVKSKSKKLAYYDHGFELAYAVTYHKIQGQTLEKVILDLNSCNTTTLTLAALYVGLSRVRCGKDIRILPISPEARKRLLGLKFSNALDRWWRMSIEK